MSAPVDVVATMFGTAMNSVVVMLAFDYFAFSTGLGLLQQSWQAELSSARQLRNALNFQESKSHEI